MLAFVQRYAHSIPSCPRRRAPKHASTWVPSLYARDLSARPLFKKTRQIVEVIVPLRVHLLDKPDFPKPSPLLHLRFAQKCDFEGPEPLVIYKPVDAVLFRETVQHILLVNAHAIKNVAGHADVERAVDAAGSNIDTRLFGHVCERAMKCTSALAEGRLGGRLRGHDVS